MAPKCSLQVSRFAGSFCSSLGSWSVEPELRNFFCSATAATAGGRWVITVKLSAALFCLNTMPSYLYFASGGLTHTAMKERFDNLKFHVVCNNYRTARCCEAPHARPVKMVFSCLSGASGFQQYDN